MKLTLSLRAARAMHLTCGWVNGYEKHTNEVWYKGMDSLIWRNKSGDRPNDNILTEPPLTKFTPHRRAP